MEGKKERGQRTHLLTLLVVKFSLLHHHFNRSHSRHEEQRPAYQLKGEDVEEVERSLPCRACACYSTSTKIMLDHDVTLEHAQQRIVLD